jgi:ribosomal protein S18 acetylase RimI-like enzyme
MYQRLLPQIEKGNFHIWRVSMEELHKEVLSSWAKLYCQIWREPPWNEEFWKVEGVIEDIRKEMQRPCAEAFLATVLRPLYNYERMDLCGADTGPYPSDEERTVVVGFTWGYRVIKNDLQQISGTDALDFLFEDVNTGVFYIDELGVNADLRKHGIGDNLSKQLLLAAQKHGCKHITLRTHVEQRAARALYSNLGFIELPVRDSKYPERSYWLKACR